MVENTQQCNIHCVEHKLLLLSKLPTDSMEMTHMLLTLAESDGTSVSSEESESDPASSGFVDRPARMYPFVMYRGECSCAVAMLSVPALVGRRRETPRRHTQTTSTARTMTQTTIPATINRSRISRAHTPTELQREHTPTTDGRSAATDIDVTFTG